MNNSTPTVLWIDEEQRDRFDIENEIYRSGARLRRAFSLAEALEALDTVRPDAIILDMILDKGDASSDEDRYTGLTVWRQLEPSLRDRTIVLSFVKHEDLPSELGIPEGHAFWKLELSGGRGRARLREFGEALRAILRS